MDSRILKVDWKIKVAALIAGLIMSTSIYFVYVAGHKLNDLVQRIGQLAQKNADDQAAKAAAAKEEADRKAGLLTTQIYTDKPKEK